MIQRRNFLSAGVAALPAALGLGASAEGRDTQNPSPFRHSVSRWCYSDLTVDELAQAAHRLGLHSVELLDPEDWPAVRRHDLTCAMVNAPWGDITTGWNRPAHHEDLIPAYNERIERIAEAGFPNLICFSGNREGLSDEKGLEHCVEGLRQIMPTAEEHGVTICMELLNSKIDHPDYQCDRTEWGLELVDRVGSERFRLLYDIYHVQIMEGDIIRTIRNHHDAIAHYHTAGVPGRNEIDETQELNYSAIMRAIAETGFTGFVGQEFVPTAEDPLTSLEAAIEICTV